MTTDIDGDRQKRKGGYDEAKLASAMAGVSAADRSPMPITGSETPA